MNTQKLINTSLTLKNLLTDKNDMVVVPLSLFNSFYLSKEINPLRIKSLSYKVNYSLFSFLFKK
jgi:hypothetical protein